MKNEEKDVMSSKDFLYGDENYSLDEENDKPATKTNLNENKNNKTKMKENNFLLLGDEEENLFLIKAFSAIEEKEEKQNNNRKDIKYELSKINKNQIENQLLLLEGIIFIYNHQNTNLLTKIIDYIIKLNSLFKDLCPGKFFPKIIVGSKKDILNIFKKRNFKEEEIKKDMDIFFYELSKNSKFGVSYAAEKLIRMNQIYREYKKYILQNNINEIEIFENTSKNVSNVLKCLECNQIYDISIDQFSNLIYLSCNKCNTELKHSYLEYEKKKNEFSIKCSNCKKTIKDLNHAHYCFICKANICEGCIKKHFQKENKTKNYENFHEIIYPYIDFCCKIHEKMNYKYCLECQKNICVNCEMESHLNHETKIYDERQINLILLKQKQNLKKEKEEYSKMKIFVEDCLDSINKFLNDLILLKEEEINIKEEMINELEMLKYDDTLIGNVNNLYFDMNEIFYKAQDSWEQKLNNLFEFFKEPIKIKRAKLCRKENLKGPYDIIQKVNLENSTYKEEMDEMVTDLVYLNNYLNKNYFAVSFNNGLLKIYNDDFAHRIPLLIIDKEFEPGEGINSLHKSLGNTLLLVGNTKIKKVYFSEDFKEYKVINEIEIENKEEIFKNVLEMECFNALIANNNYNQLIIYTSKNGKKVDTDPGGEIAFFDKIAEKKIILQIQHNNTLDEIHLDINRQTISKDISKISIVDPNIEEELNNISNSICVNNSSNDITWIIYEFEMKMNEINIKKNYQFNKGISYLGKINEQLLLFYNSLENKLILFDSITYINFMRLPFNASLKPIFSFPLNRRIDYLELLILCEGEYLAQCTMDLKIGFMYVIAKIKIAKQNINMNISLNSNSTFSQKGENKTKNNIVKIVKFRNTNFLIMTEDNLIYNIKYSLI